MKKTISLLTILSLTVSCGLCVMAADKENGEPDVYVDGNRILFADQNAKIVDGRTLVPARGVFEAMGCRVSWDGETRVVTVTSSTGVRSAYITIDSDKLRVTEFKTLFLRDEQEISLDVAAQIMNDRTMIPLRAVSEAFDCEVLWDEDNYAVNITTGAPPLLEGYTYTAPDEASMVHMSLTTDKTGRLETGEEFAVYIDDENVPQDTYCSAVVATLEYDKTKFEYVPGSGTLIGDNGDAIEASLSDENTELESGTKVFFLLIEGENASRQPGHAFKAVFRSLNGESGTIALGKTYESIRGYGTYLMYTSDDTEAATDKIYSGNDIVLGAPLTIGE